MLSNNRYQHISIDIYTQKGGGAAIHITIGVHRYVMFKRPDWRRRPMPTEGPTEHPPGLPTEKPHKEAILQTKHKRQEDTQTHEGTSTVIKVYTTVAGEQLTDKGQTTHTKDVSVTRTMSQDDKTGTGERS